MTRFTCSSAQLKGFGALSIKFNSTPTKDWNCSDWVTWHKLLVAAFQGGAFSSGIKYNQAKAIELSNQVFRTWWEKLSGFFSSNKSWCGYESLFYSYMKQVGLTDVLTIFQKLVNPLTNTAVNVVETGSKVVDTAAAAAENVADAAKNSTDVLKWLVPTVIVVGVGGVGFWAYNHYLK